MIKPGQTFSFNKRVGPRTPERGFKEGQAIVGGLLLPSIGGGVCQVATTVFDAAFYAGLPITSRVNHAWYISHYAMGMDATVADGGPDLVFKNDTKYGILIRASASASTMTVTLYSTDRGLRVEKIAGQPHDQTTPKARYILNPALKGAEKTQRDGRRGRLRDRRRADRQAQRQGRPARHLLVELHRRVALLRGRPGVRADRRRARSSTAPAELHF